MITTSGLQLPSKMISAADGEIYLKLGPKGGKDGFLEAWDDGFGGDVKQICICHGEYIDSIQTTYERDGITVVSNRHGGTEGNFDVISFNEPLTWVSGYYGRWCLDPEDAWRLDEDDPGNYITIIRSLKFGTGRATYGPFGKEKGERFRYNSSTGICGFHGYCSNGESGMLRAMGVYVRAMAVRPINNDPIPTMATPTQAIISPPLQDMAESNETSTTGS
ncbi:inactive protein RESTRICTED TEV MOVEMENT 1 [Elaeis guineensis]|uniref:Jacalin-related lectin 3 n=1 Tax=Elaeis guineensis var. tenera TaxID=51953 RepID=A0A6I9RRR2_ELAGV|nr:jacalin-related lectin 3 [Elaeis guineensis]